MATYKIHEDFIDRIQKKAAHVQKKCSKYGCDFSFAQVGEEFVEHEEDGFKVVDRYILVEAHGTAVQNGWQFVAAIDHLESGNIIRNATDISVPNRYYTCGPKCEHCKSDRPRKNTFIVYNAEEDRFAQVGSSCLQEFTGGLSIEATTSFYDMLKELDDTSGSSSGSRKTYYEVPFILGYAVQIVKNFGYVSSQSWDNSTKEHVSDYYSWFNGRRKGFEYVEAEASRIGFLPENSDKIYSEVEDILACIRSMDDDSNYMHNLKVLADTDYIDYKSLGYLVSMVSVYNKKVERDIEVAKQKKLHEKELSSKYQGSEGDKLDLYLDSMTCVYSWENQYGYTYRYKMVDTAGNVYMWDSSKYIEDAEDVQSIRGTVKKHEEFRGVKQTWLTRCKVTKYKEVIEEEHPAGVDMSEIFSQLDLLFEGA